MHISWLALIPCFSLSKRLSQLSIIFQRVSRDVRTCSSLTFDEAEDSSLAPLSQEYVSRYPYIMPQEAV